MLYLDCRVGNHCFKDLKKKKFQFKIYLEKLLKPQVYDVVDSKLRWEYIYV